MLSASERALKGKRQTMLGNGTVSDRVVSLRNGWAEPHFFRPQVRECQPCDQTPARARVIAAGSSHLKTPLSSVESKS